MSSKHPEMNYKREELLEKAIKTAKGKKDEDTNFTLIYALSLQGKHEEALALVRDIKGKEKNLVKMEKNAALKFIAQGLAKTGKHKPALEIAGKIESGIEKDVVLNVIVIQLARANKFDQALEICGKIQSDFYRIWSLAAVASRMCIAGKSCKGLFKEALDMTHGIKENLGQVRALSTIASEMAKAGISNDDLIEEALNIATREDNTDDRVRAFSAIASSLVYMGKSNKNIIGKALEDIDKIDNDFLKKQAMGKIIEVMAISGDYDKALKMLEDIKDAYQKKCTLKNISYKLATLGKFDEAVKMANRLEDSSEVGWVYTIIASEMNTKNPKVATKPRSKEEEKEIPSTYYYTTGILEEATIRLTEFIDEAERVMAGEKEMQPWSPIIDATNKALSKGYDLMRQLIEYSKKYREYYSNNTKIWEQFLIHYARLIFNYEVVLQLMVYSAIEWDDEWDEYTAKRAWIAVDLPKPAGPYLAWQLNFILEREVEFVEIFRILLKEGFIEDIFEDTFDTHGTGGALILENFKDDGYFEKFNEWVEQGKQLLPKWSEQQKQLKSIDTRVSINTKPLINNSSEKCETKNEIEIFKFCPICGKKLNLSKQPNFCPYCREKLS